MGDFLKRLKSLVLGQKDADNVVGSLNQFNKAASAYIDLLNKRIENKQKEVSRIRVLVQGNAPIPKASSLLNITVLDKNNTLVRQKGKGSYFKKMDWDTPTYKKNKGTII